MPLGSETTNQRKFAMEKKEPNVDPPLTLDEIKAILRKEEVAESTGVLDPDRDKMRLCRQLLDLMGDL